MYDSLNCAERHPCLFGSLLSCMPARLFVTDPLGRACFLTGSPSRNHAVEADHNLQSIWADSEQNRFLSILKEIHGKGRYIRVVEQKSQLHEPCFTIAYPIPDYRGDSAYCVIAGPSRTELFPDGRFEIAGNDVQWGGDSWRMVGKDIGPAPRSLQEFLAPFYQADARLFEEALENTVCGRRDMTHVVLSIEPRDYVETIRMCCLLKRRDDHVEVLWVSYTSADEDINPLRDFIHRYTTTLTMFAERDDITCLKSGIRSVLAAWDRLLHNSVTRGIVDEIKSVVAFYESKVKVALDPKAERLRVGPAAARDIQNVMDNLISNALAASEAHQAVRLPSVEVCVESVTLDSDVNGIVGSLWAGCECVKLAVRDSGAGISQEVRNRLFLGTVASMKVGGHGIGAVSVSRSVLRLGGALQLTSSIDAGTCVTVYIPAEPINR